MSERVPPAPAPRVYVETYGCAFNQADGETLAGVLAADGFELVRSEAEADLVVLNTCTVKDRTWAHFEHRFGTLRRAAEQQAGPAVLLAGCIPKANPRSRLLRNASAISPGQVGRIGEAARRVLRGETVRLLEGAGDEAVERPNLPQHRTREQIEVLPIAAGCLSACSFCQTRLARGRLKSFRPGDLLRRAEAAVREGVAEIWLTAQDAGAYGQDIDYPLPRLLRALCEIEGDFRIRLGMTSPCWILERLDEYLEVFAHPKLLTTWHVPLQSGSDAVLEHMRRGNSGEAFVRLAQAFHCRYPEGALITDVIVGYPSETESDFAATLAVLCEAKIAGVNRSKFSARPGTPAEGLTPLPGPLVKERMARLTQKCEELGLAWHGRFTGREEWVRTIEVKRRGSTIAHNQSGRPVVLPGSLALGEWHRVKYVNSTINHLRAVKA